MAAWLGSPPAAGASSRLMILCLSGDRRRHQRKRDLDSSKRIHHQQQQQLNPSPEVGDRLIINIDDMSKNAREALRRVARFGNEFVDECRATVRVSRESGVVISLTRKPVEYAGFAAALLLLVGLVVRVVMSSRSWRKERVVVRRDRSLGGKEVVVKSSTRTTPPPAFERKNPFISLEEPAQEPRKSVVRKPGPRTSRVPEWWDSSLTSASAADSHDQARVNSIVRVIVEKRLSGKDFMEDDIVELRQICRSTGAKADFGTENTRDSLFRAAVAFVLSACSRSFVDYGGESMISFICGLARNINLEASKAGSIVNAAVAAKTRSGFLQAWANVAQGKLNEADEEIRQIVSMHNVFPPEMNSPHMEMVGRGLESHLSLSERGELFNMYTKLSGKKNEYVAVEALGLPISYML